MDEALKTSFSYSLFPFTRSFRLQNAVQVSYPAILCIQHIHIAHSPDQTSTSNSFISFTVSLRGNAEDTNPLEQIKTKSNP